MNYTREQIRTMTLGELHKALYGAKVGFDDRYRLLMPARAGREASEDRARLQIAWETFCADVAPLVSELTRREQLSAYTEAQMEMMRDKRLWRVLVDRRREVRLTA